jgi:hypothetical protein
MNLFFAEHFGVSAAKTAEFVGDSTFAEILDYLVTTKVPPFDLSQYAFQRILFACKKERLKLPLTDWATTHKVLPMLDEMSALELEILGQVNPYYAMYAFGVSFDACIELTQRMDIQLETNVAAHALLWHLLQSSPKIVIEDAHAELVKRGCPVTEQLEHIDVFPSRFLDTHPLRKVDPDVESASVMKEMVSDYRNIVSCIRERKFLANRVVALRGKYMVRNKAVQFVAELSRVQANAQKLRIAIKKEYKRIKSSV